MCCYGKVAVEYLRGPMILRQKVVKILSYANFYSQSVEENPRLLARCTYLFSTTHTKLH